MNEKNERILDHISDVLQHEDLPEVYKAELTIGDYGKLIPLKTLQEVFEVITMQFVADNDYSMLECKVNPDSDVIFHVRVKNSELEKTTTTKESYKVPAEEQLAEVPIVADPV